MSSIKINRDALNKLTHKSDEIRLRTLEQLSAKVTRALELNGEIEFKPVDMCKQLIRWFGFLPPRQPLKVLNLLKSVIESSKYGSQVIEKLGSERLVKELRKIQTLFDSQSTEYKTINKIKEFVKNISHSKEKQVELMKRENLDYLIDDARKFKIEKEFSEHCIEDYEAPWSSASPSDFATMKFLSDILINKFASNTEIENAVQHLQLTLSDYPAEYLLQAPHIFENLLQLYDQRKTHNINVDCIASALLQFLIILEKRLKMSRKTLSFSKAYIENKNASSQLNSEMPRQLKVEKALGVLLDASIYHLESNALHGGVSPVVWEVILMILNILEYMRKSVDISCLCKVASVVSNLSTKFAETEHCAILRLHQMLLIFFLQDVVQKKLCPDSSKAINIFEPILRDYNMKNFFAIRHQLTEDFVFISDRSLEEKYQSLKLYEKSIDKSINMLKNKINWSSSDIVKDGQLVCKVLNVLQSKELTDVLLSGIIQGIPLYHKNDQIKKQAINILFKLLRFSEMPIKKYIYEKLSDAFKRQIGCLMTGERYALECSNADLLKAQIIGVPLNTDILKQIVFEIFESTSDQIKNNCCKIIELLIKSQNLFQIHWFSILPLVIPLMPLLNCCTFSEEIIDLLVKLLDPDLRQLPFICVLQGNIGFLFHSNAARRSEALNRLFYIINSLKDAEMYIPNLLEMSDTLPNDICFKTSTREFKNIFYDRLPLREELVSSLINLLHLLESPDVDPLIRKTTLMQINVLCNNWYITAELCSAGAFYLILQALEGALQKSSKLDYADAAAPAISILSKVIMYDSAVRSELAETPNIYVLVLRALFMFQHDIQVCQDAALCLFMLLFSSYIVSTENSAEGPLILSNIKMPIDLNLRPALNIKNDKDLENLSSILSSSLEESHYFRMVLASSYCDGLKNVTQKTINILSKLDIAEKMKLTNLDVRLIRATQPNVSLHRLLKAAVNATDPRSLIQACTLLKQQLLVPLFKNTISVSEDFCVQINGIFKRYLQMPPGNDDDFDIYEHLLDIATTCLNISLQPVALEVFKSLYKDSHHALITMLTQAEEIPFRIYNKITTFLRQLISEYENVLQNQFKAAECSIFFRGLFDFFIERCLQLFEKRDLQRVRCLLSLIVPLSDCPLNLSDELSLYYCRRSIQLSLALKSFTQTGAQWHRDCLLIILRLNHQMNNFSENFRLTGSFIKYLSGLCGHSDMEVRTLAWSILNIAAKTKSIVNKATEQKSFVLSGSELLLNELSYLPGGFMACCLSTFLDADEAVSVRHLAGQLLAALIRTQGEVKDIEKLLDLHNFIRFFNEALTTSVCVSEMELPVDLDISHVSITTTDLISCYSLICIELSQRSPAFLTELCTKSFMFKLYEIFKQPPPSSKHVGYMNMVGHISRLYTLCHSDNFAFLQRTICRDSVWLGSFCEILFRIVSPSNDFNSTVKMVQLLLILLKDSTALEQISIKLQEYSNDIVRLFQNAFNVKRVKTSFQSCSLSILSFLLVKSQSDNHPDISFQILKLLDSESILIKSVTINELFESEDKENTSITKKNKNKEKLHISEKEKIKSSISEYLCISLVQLFSHLYPVKVCKFSTPPNLNQQHVTETLALLLKQSLIAQETAENLKFQERVLNLFKNFFEEFATTSCTSYLKRNGASKKSAVIKNFQLLLKLWLCWFSAPNIVITDNILALEYCKIIIQIWSWLAHSTDLKLTVLQLCSFLSDRSLVVCKQFSTLNNCSFQHSVLQLVTKMITAETLKIKANSSDCNIFINAGLRVLINCCSCSEGRNALNKMRVLDVFETLYPFNPKVSQSRKDIVYGWLEFWEIFSRYEEGAQSRHLNALCSVVNKSSPACPIRLISLRILRNMAFLNSNKSALITSTDFMFTVSEIVSQPIQDSVEEQFIMCIALWKLISGGIKFVAMIRGTKLAKNLRSLMENLKIAKDEKTEASKFSDDLLNVLSIIFKIFNN